MRPAARRGPVAAATAAAAAAAAAALTLALGLGGCLSYRLDRLPEAGDLPAPPSPPERVSATYVLHRLAGSDDQFMTTEATAFAMAPTADDLAAVLTATGWFRSVAPARRPDAPPQDAAAAPDDADAPADAVTPEPAPAADLHLECVLTVDSNDYVLAASAFTFFIVPTWRTTTYELIAEASAPDGRWKRYRYMDATRDIHWLPLVLVMSFRPWGEAYGELRRNLYRTLAADLLADRFLRRPAPAP